MTENERLYTLYRLKSLGVDPVNNNKHCAPRRHSTRLWFALKQLRDFSEPTPPAKFAPTDWHSVSQEQQTVGQHHHLLLVDSGCVYSGIGALLQLVNIHISSSITHVPYHFSLPSPPHPHLHLHPPPTPVPVNSLWSAHLAWLPARPAAGWSGRARGERGFHPRHLQVAAQDRNLCVRPVQPEGQQQVLWVHRDGEAQQR